MTTQTPATAEMEKWLRIRVVFHTFLTPGPDPKEKRRILPESTPVNRIRSYLWFISGRELDAGYATFCLLKQKTGYACCWDTTSTFYVS